MPDYPLVAIPLAFSAALEALPPLPTPPVPVPAPIYPHKLGLTPQGALWLPVLVLLAIGWLLAQDMGIAAGLLAVSSLLAGWWAAHRSKRQFERAVEKFHADFHRHRAYPDELRHYEQMQKQYATTEAVAHYRAWRVAQVLTTVKLPFRPVPAKEFAPVRGRSEAVFLRHLQQHFGADTLFVNRRVRVDDLSLNTDWYYPDVVYRDASGLCIDVEIDEPYVWSTGEPHHYEGQDDARNAFFLRKNWIVLRFTEEQVMRTPVGCCQVLAALIFHLTGQDYPICQQQERPTRQSQWTWVEAKRLASQGVRERYQGAER